MISLLLALILTVWLLRSFWRNPAFLLVAIFLTWQFVLKVGGVVFLDIFGPIYADEVFTTVGGIGHSAPMMILFVVIPLLMIKIALSRFSPRKTPHAEAGLGATGFTFGDLITAALVALVVCLYADMLRLGYIPLFERLERYEYEGGVFHQFLVTYLSLIGFIIGYVITRGRLLTGVWDVRLASIVLALFVYLFLTGHRFGSFYVLISFTLLPMAALFVAPKIGIVVAPRIVTNSRLLRLVTSRLALAAFSILLVGLVLVAMANSLLVMRDGDPHERLLQRLFVQPVHLYWLTWERLEHSRIQDVAMAYDFIFNHPFDAARNTGIQYLMMMHIGVERAFYVFQEQGADYAGGYPEILIEMTGFWFAVLLAVIASAIIAILYRVCIMSVCRGHFLSSLLSMYVCLGPINLFLGGMVNFITAETYWMKVLGLLLALGIDRSYERRGGHFIPWVLGPQKSLLDRPC